MSVVETETKGGTASGLCSIEVKLPLCQGPHRPRLEAIRRLALFDPRDFAFTLDTTVDGNHRCGEHDAALPFVE